jgi:hypothetical protein
MSAAEARTRMYVDQDQPRQAPPAPLTSRGAPRAPCIVITGMHRSGTSLIASLLQRAGVDVGRRLLPAGAANPRGFFEDLDFLEFHEAALRRRGHSHFVPESFAFEATPDELDHARSLLAGRTDRDLWGWKDPRTALFLPFWQDLLDSAVFVLVYRHPLEVLLSLMRRGEPGISGLIEGLDAWCVYNTRIREFHERHAARCVLAEIHRTLAEPERLRALMTLRLGRELAFSRETRDAIYHPAELRRPPLAPSAERLLDVIHPGCVELFRTLEKLADLGGGPAGEKPQDSIALDSLHAWSRRWPRSGDRPWSRGVLALLTSELDPEATEAYFAAGAARVGALEVARSWLDDQRQRWEKLAAEREALLKEQVSGREELEAARTWLTEQRDRWEAQAQAEAAVVQDQQRWIADLETARTWLTEQRDRWEAQAQTQAAVVQDRQRWIADLETARTWLTEQRDRWEAQARARAAEAEALALELGRAADHRDTILGRLDCLREEIRARESEMTRWGQQLWIRLGLRIGLLRPLPPIPDGPRPEPRGRGPANEDS